MLLRSADIDETTALALVGAFGTLGAATRFLYQERDIIVVNVGHLQGLARKDLARAGAIGGYLAVVAEHEMRRRQLIAISAFMRQDWAWIGSRADN